MQEVFDFSESFDDEREMLSRLFKLTRKETHPFSKNYLDLDYEYNDIKLTYEYRPFHAEGKIYKGGELVEVFNPRTSSHLDLVKSLMSLIDKNN